MHYKYMQTIQEKKTTDQFLHLAKRRRIESKTPYSYNKFKYQTKTKGLLRQQRRGYAIRRPAAISAPINTVTGNQEGCSTWSWHNLLTWKFVGCSAWSATGPHQLTWYKHGIYLPHIDDSTARTFCLNYYHQDLQDLGNCFEHAPSDVIDIDRSMPCND